MTEFNSNNAEEIAANAHAYLHGMLDPEETEAFEIYLMEHPNILEQLELDSLLKAHITDIDIKAPHNDDSAASLWHWFMGSRLRFSLSLSMTFAMGFLVSNFSVQQSDVPLRSDSLEIAYVSELRGNTEAPDLILPLNPEVKTLILVIQPSSSKKMRYEVSVREINDKYTLISGRVYQSNELGEILLSLNTNELEPSIISVQYAALGTPEKIESLYIKLTP